MYRIKWLAMFLACGLLLTACGEQEKKAKVMLYQGKKGETEEQHYKTTKVRRDTYEEKISSTAELTYQNEKVVSISDSHAHIDKFCVKNGQQVKKGDALAIYHVKVSETSMKKKKLELEQAKSEYDSSLKSKRNEVLQQERSLKTLTDETEKKLARLQLKRLQAEYKEAVAKGKEVRKQEKEYNDLASKRKSATLRSKYTGTVAEIMELSDESVTGETVMLIRDKKDFLLSAEDAAGMRYNMTVDVGLGNTLDNIKHHMKGKVISTDNLQNAGQAGTDENAAEAMEASSQLIRIAKSDREKYDFTKYNIYITGVSLKIENALIIDADAVNEETENEETKYFVYVVEKGKLHKRYIVSNYKQEKIYLVNQGLEEGQTLAILSK